jgi:hypothetical protein
MLPLLGAYLGHVSVSSTEAYLAVMPERFLTQLSRLSSDTRQPENEGAKDANGVTHKEILEQLADCPCSTQLPKQLLR